MEHVGAILYKAAALFLDSGATKDQLNTRAAVIAHETSHTWFGDMVTMQWFNDVWTKEVFANFMADKIIQANRTTSTYALKFLIDHYPAAYAVDRTVGANPIRQNLDNLQDAGTLYGNIIYHKAPVMMLQLERLMGKDSLQAGLSEYLNTYKFNNATWPDLISILSKHTNADLNSWNKVWVNETGRAQITYSLEQHDSVISKLGIFQQGELNPGNILPQFFEAAFFYGDSSKEITVNMNQHHVIVDSLKGVRVPDFILFNSSGQGYGIFPIDTNMFSHLALMPSRLMRASAYINLYENMLNGSAVTPKQLMNIYTGLPGKEKDGFNIVLITGYINNIFWRFILPAERDSIAPVLEKLLWTNMMNEPDASKKKTIFKTYQSIALSSESKDSLYNIWKAQRTPGNLILTEDDYTSLASTLALKNYTDTNILQQQLTRIQNPDRKNRLQFLIPALSADSSVRDSFFILLLDKKNRGKEDWVTTGLSYLQYPTRGQTSEKYLRQGLDVLQEIQRTGGIFFPAAWLQSLFAYYQTPEATGIVRTFIKEHPDYNPKLMAKILQAADPLFRAEKLLYH